MSAFYDEIMLSIEETKEASKKGKLKETIFVRPVRVYHADSIKKLRKSLKLTQAVFAAVLGVSKKAVEAWESGRNVPMGPSSRMLDLIAEDHTIVDRFLNVRA